MTIIYFFNKYINVKIRKPQIIHNSITQKKNEHLVTK